MTADSQLFGYLASTAIRDTDVAATVGVTALPKGGGGFHLGVAARHSGSGEYAGVVVVSSTGANPTTIRARAWKPGATEPTTWQVSTTDSTRSLQTAGSVGIGSYLSAGTTSGPIAGTSDDFAATTLTPANAAPTASFTATPSGWTVAFDGTGSKDADGTIASYAWTFGDGSTGTGATTGHTYAAGGTYTVTLTVTDGQGATGTSRQQVAVPSQNRSPVPTLLEQSNALTATFWGNQSTDPDGTIVAYAWTFGDG